MMIWIAWESQGVEPKRVNRSVRKLCEARRDRHEMRQVVAQNIMPDDMCETGAKQVKFFERGFRVPFPMNNPLSLAFRHRCKGEYPGVLGIDLQINRQTARQDFGVFPRHLNTAHSRQISFWLFGLLGSATTKRFRYAAGNYVFHNARLVFISKERTPR